MHCFSIGQDRQLVASPAAAGFRDRLKYESVPVEDSVLGR